MNAMEMLLKAAIDGALSKYYAPTDHESRVQAWEDKGLTRSDAQGAVEAEDMKASRKVPS